MLNKIIHFSVNNKLVVALFTLALIGYGSYQFTQLPIDAVPDITDNQVQVITVTPSLGAPDVERLITFPIEQANSNIPGLKEMRSFSRFGLSLITIVFNDDVDIYWARQQVTERLKIAETQIPKGIGSPELAPVTTGLGEIYQYVLKPMPGYEAKYDAIELRTIQDWIVRRQLLGVPGVADVSSFGGRVKQYEIAVNPAILKAHNISINEVFSALEKNNENTGGAYIEKDATVLYIRSEGLVKNLADIGNIPVKYLANGTPVLVKNIAEVRVGKATRYGALTYNDEGEVAGAVVMMLKGGNSSRVIADVKERIEQIRKTLPEGISLEPFLDRTKMVNSAINTVSKNLLEGALIVIFILVLFLGNLRAGIIVASVIPLSMLFAITLMNRFGVSGNLMSLGALDFGLIVDGAVIIVEAVMHRLHSGNKIPDATRITQAEMDEAVQSSASRMMNSAVFGQIIILVVYLPIFTLQGIEGKMFKPMALTVAFALLGAFILSLTYVPVMSAVFLSKTISHKRNLSDRMMDFFIGAQQKYLAVVLRFKYITVAVSVLLLAGAIFLFTRLGGEFIPQLPEGDFAVETRVLTGSNLQVSTQAIAKSAHILLSRFPEVEKVVGKTGSGEIPTDPMPMEASDMMVILKDRDEWTSAETWQELSEKMTEALKEVPGVTYSFQYPVAMRFNELMTGAKQDVVCKIFGENLDTLSKYSKILGEVAAKIEGTKNVYVEPVDGLPQLIINYKREAIAQYGLTIQDVNRVVNMAFAGQATGMVYEDEKRFDLVVRLADEQRQRLEDVQNLPVPASNGNHVPLYQVADVSIAESVNQIQREDAKRRIIVGFNVIGRDVQSIVSDLQKLVSEKVKLPSGYYIAYGGSFENLQAAKERLTLAVPLSLALIFLFLYLAFGSIKQGLLIYSAIPLSIIGGTLFLAIRNIPFSISAGVGFIALFGVAVLNGIVLIAEFNRIRKEGETNLQQIVLQGTKHRLRPVLMTAFVASLGFLPMAISNGNGAEVQRPLATVVIGGLLVATLLTLFVLPVLYILFDTIGQAKPGNRLVKTITVVGLLLAAFTERAAAQETITLKAAIDSAIRNNLLVRNEWLNAEYQRKLKAATADIPQTNLSAQYGQFNSIYKDNSFNVSQSISFPLVYVKQNLLQKEVYANSLLSLAVKEVEIKKQVSEVFCQLIYLSRKKNILLSADTIYSLFLQKATLRAQKGEANTLEKAMAETQRGQIALQLNTVSSQIEIYRLRFQLLLNTYQAYLPEQESYNYTAGIVVDSAVAANHPQVKYLQQLQRLARANIGLQKAKFLPNLNLGYNSTTIQGMGADNRTYTLSTRFHAVQFGIGVPLFFGPQLAKVKAEKMQELIATNNYNAGVQTFKADYAAAVKNYEACARAVKYYTDTALPNAAAIAGAANEQFSSGEINYLEWAMLMNSATAIQSGYIDALNDVNMALTMLHYLAAK